MELDGRPFAEYQLDWLRDEGVTHVVYCLGHLGEQVVEALGDGDRWGMRFDFVMDGPMLLGTGGALRRAMPSRADEFFVLYGDSLLTCDLAAVERGLRGRPTDVPDDGLPERQPVGSQQRGVRRRRDRGL